ncbi:hypothetical protein PGB90_000710 [Kerria lacca]
MCSILEEDFMYEKSTISQELCKNIDVLCKKCLDNIAMIKLQKKHHYCKDCFVNIITHKFRATLGKTKLIKPDDKVLIAFTGNQSSITLLHLLKLGVNEQIHKRFKFHPVILFIDESIFWPKEKRMVDLPKIMKALKNSGFKYYITKLSSIYDNYTFQDINDVNDISCLKENESDNKLLSLFHNIQSDTSKTDFLLRLRYQIQFKIARILNYNKIFTAENTTDLSIRVLSNISLGRGLQVSFDVAVCDQKIPDIYLIRPLREITSKEIVFYNVFNKIESLAVPSIFPMMVYNSLQHETELFVYQLQEEFPSTVYSVFHIGEKLKTYAVKENMCHWCHNPILLDTSGVTCLKESMVHIMSKYNWDKPDDKDDEEITNKNFALPSLLQRIPGYENAKQRDIAEWINGEIKKDTHCGNCISNRMTQKLKQSLCYGCQHILDDMKSLDYLPIGILHETVAEFQANELRKEIEDFLL